MGNMDSRSLVAGVSSSIVTSIDPAEDAKRTVVPRMGFTGAFSVEDVGDDGAVSEVVLGWLGLVIGDDGAAEFAGVGWAGGGWVGAGATEVHPARTKLMARAQLMTVTQAIWPVGGGPECMVHIPSLARVVAAA
jgi:hypothetical protein